MPFAVKPRPCRKVSPAQERRLSSVSDALAIRDRYTDSHARRVAAYAERLARRLGLCEPEIEIVRTGGLFHDIGKLGFSDRTFSNADVKVSADMQEEIRRHPTLGAFLLQDLNCVSPVLDCVHYHHERVDGKGYPFGLKLDEIPLSARIISVADCFDAITTDRPYQKGKSPGDALTILREIKGKSLDPALVDAFCEEIEENGTVAG